MFWPKTIFLVQKTVNLEDIDPSISSNGTQHKVSKKYILQFLPS